MSKPVKIILGISAFVAILLIALVVMVKVFVTPERVKAVVLPLAEQALHRSITLGDVKVGLFSGIELHDLAVGEPEGGEPFVAADRVLLRFQWLPLLSKQVVIDEVALERPLIRLIRHADGSFNISDLLAPKPAGAPSGKAGEDKGGEPLSVLVTVAKIHGGRLVFVDRQIAATSELTELELDASGISRDGTVPVKLSARLQGAALKVDGAVRPLQKTGKVNIDLQGLDALAFEPYFRGKVPGKLSRLLLDLKGEFDLQGRVVTARGNLAGRELNLFLLALPTAPLQNATVKVDYDVSLDLERDRLAIASLGFDFNGLVAQLGGEISGLTAAPKGDLKLTVPELDLATLDNALPPALLGKAGELDLAGKLRVSASLNGPLSQPLRMLRSGEIDLDKVQATVGGIRPAIDGRIVLEQERARFEQTSVRLGELSAGVSGTLAQLFSAPVADLVITLPRTDLGQALASVPAEQVKGVAGLAPSGAVEGRVQLRGALARPKDLLQGGELLLSEVQVNAAGQRPLFNGRLRLSGDRLTSEGLKVRLGSDSAQLDVTARNLFGKPLQVAADVTAQRLLIEPLLAGGAASKAAGGGSAPAGAAEAQGARLVAGGEVGPFDLPVQAAGTIRIGETVWKGLNVRNFLAEYDLRDNQLNIKGMSGSIAGGTFANTARVDLRQPGLVYDATINLQGVEAQSLLPALAPEAAGTLFGRLDLQSSVRGSGTRWETLSRTLNGDAALALADGRLVSPTLVKGFAAFLQLAELNDIAFKEFRGKARIVNGQAEIDSLLAGSRIKLAPRGTLGLDGGLRLAMDTRLAPELVARLDRKGKVTGYLTDADGWTQVPLLLEGTLKTPRFSLDPKGVQAQAGKALQNELQRGLDKLLKKSQPQPTAPADSTQQQPAGTAEPAPQPVPPPDGQAPVNPSQKLLEESLKKVFGR